MKVKFRKVQGTVREIYGTSGEESECFGFFAVIAWAVLLVLLLYLWADVREMAGLVKEMKKELLRSHLSVRAAESFPNFQEEQQKEAEQAAKKAEERRQQEKRAGSPLKPAEERVLEEVLTEFLG